MSVGPRPDSSGRLCTSCSGRVSDMPSPPLAQEVTDPIKVRKLTPAIRFGCETQSRGKALLPSSISTLFEICNVANLLQEFLALKAIKLVRIVFFCRRKKGLDHLPRSRLQEWHQPEPGGAAHLGGSGLARRIGIKTGSVSGMNKKGTRRFGTGRVGLVGELSYKTLLESRLPAWRQGRHRGCLLHRWPPKGHRSAILRFGKGSINMMRLPFRQIPTAID